MADRAKAASKDSLEAFKVLALDPIGGLATAFSSLGEARALGAGIVFGVTFAVSLFIAACISHFRPDGFGDFLKFIVCSIIPFLAMAGACFVGRKAFRGEGSIAVDVFVAGASLLPLAFAALASSILGFVNVEVMAMLVTFALVLNILMLFTGFVRIAHISERGATLTVPLVLLASIWFSKIIYASLLSSAMRYMF